MARRIKIAAAVAFLIFATWFLGAGADMILMGGQ